MKNANVLLPPGELCFNIWFVIDIGTNLSSHCYLKPYFLDGNDDEKLNILQKLAETDYITCQRFAFATDINVHDSESIYNDVIPVGGINLFFDQNIDFFLKVMESDLPPIIRFSGKEDCQADQFIQEFPSSPLYCMTFLYENEYGKSKPNTSQVNKDWIKSERNRLTAKSLLFGDLKFGAFLLDHYIKHEVFSFTDMILDYKKNFGNMNVETFKGLKGVYRGYREIAPDDVFEKLDNDTREVKHEQHFTSESSITDTTEQKHNKDHLMEKFETHVFPKKEELLNRLDELLESIENKKEI